MNPVDWKSGVCVSMYGRNVYFVFTGKIAHDSFLWSFIPRNGVFRKSAFASCLFFCCFFLERIQNVFFWIFFSIQVFFIPFEIQTFTLLVG